jgi:hypothetical protein
LGFNAERRRAFADLPPALEGFFIASTLGYGDLPLDDLRRLA